MVVLKWQWLWIVLAVVFALYGLLVRSVGSGTGFFMVWLSMSAASLLCALAAHFHLWGRLPFFLRIVFLILIVLAAGVFFFVEAQILEAFHEKPEKNLDYLIVPGAQIHKSGPSVVLRYRLDEACQYLLENENTVCIVTGGQGYNEPYPEAVGMKEYLVAHGIEEKRILLETESKNTKENMVFSQKYFDPKKDQIGVVTNNFHVFRACALARKSGILHVSGIAAGSTKLYLPNNLLREFMGVVKDFACGNI